MASHVLGRLVGNTGDPTNLSMVLNSSFAGRRGEFVRVRHREQEGDTANDVLARIVSISRSNVLYNSGLGQAVTELELLPGAHVTGEQIMGKLEAIGYRDPRTGRSRCPGARLTRARLVEPVDFQFLSAFYEFQEHSSLHIGNLVGYERGATAVPVYLEVNRLVTEHFAVLAMTGSGKSYTVGPHHRAAGRASTTAPSSSSTRMASTDATLQGGRCASTSDPDELDDQRDRAALPAIRDAFTRLRKAGAGIADLQPAEPVVPAEVRGRKPGTCAAVRPLRDGRPQRDPAWPYRAAAARAGRRHPLLDCERDARRPATSTGCATISATASTTFGSGTN